MTRLPRILKRLALDTAPQLRAWLSPEYRAARGRTTIVLRGPEAAKALVPYVRDAAFEHLPPSVIERCKQLVLDGLACTLLGLREQNSAALRRLVPCAGAGATACTLIGSTTEMSCADAVFAHAALAQVFDGNDGWEGPIPGGSYHAGRVILPLCLSLSEACGCSGRKLLTAQAIGYEIARRTRSSFGRSPSDLLGAVAAAAYLLDLSEDQTIHALSLADLHGPAVAPGPANFAFDANHLSAGYIARTGLEAAHQARAGMTAPPLRPQIESIVPRANQEATWDSVLSTYIKPYPACRYLHGAIEGAIAFNTTQGWPVAQIDQVRVEASGSDFIAERATPETSPKRCQFSLPYAVTCVLLDGNFGDRQLRPDRIGASDVQQLQRRVSVKALRPTGPRITRMEIRRRDGQVFSTVIDKPKGGSRNPFTWQELVERFNRWTEVTLSEDQQQQIAATVAQLDSIEDVRTLTGLLRSVSDKVASVGPATAGEPS